MKNNSKQKTNKNLWDNLFTYDDLFCDLWEPMNVPIFGSTGYFNKILQKYGY